jgi:hypothetical protein
MEIGYEKELSWMYPTYLIDFPCYLLFKHPGERQGGTGGGRSSARFAAGTFPGS